MERIFIDELRKRAKKAGGFLVADPFDTFMEGYLSKGIENNSLQNLLKELALFYESGEKENYSVFNSLFERMPGLEDYIKRVAEDYACSKPDSILEGLKKSNRNYLSDKEEIGIEGFIIKIPKDFIKQGLPRLICKGFCKDGKSLERPFNQVLPVEELCKSVGAYLSDLFENPLNYDLTTGEIVDAIRYLNDLRESRQDGFFSALGGNELLNKGINRLFCNQPTKGLDGYVAEAKF